MEPMTWPPDYAQILAYLELHIPSKTFPSLHAFSSHMKWGITLISYYIISLKLHRNGIVEIEKKNLAKT